MRSLKLAVAIALVASTSAFGAFAESEPNNTAATADPIVLPGGCLAADVGLATLAVGGGDVDYYSVVVPQGCILTAITTPMDVYPADPDTILAIMSPADALILENDDATTSNNANNGGSAGVGRGSAIRFLNNGATNTYFLRVRGFDATAGSQGQYALTVSLVPEPTTLALLSIGALALIRRRK